MAMTRQFPPGMTVGEYCALQNRAMALEADCTPEEAHDASVLVALKIYTAAFREAMSPGALRAYSITKHDMEQQ